MNTANAMLFLHAQTSLHPGTGTALGTVDLPIQRERHTGWPTIAGSSLKGVIREHCRSEESDSDYDKWLAVFGPKTDEAELHAGAISFTDARILAFPVRSGKSVFAWITCPEVLGRLERDATLAGDVLPSSLTTKPADGEGVAFTPPQSPLLISEGSQSKLLLEEYDFTVDLKSAGCEDAEKIADWLSQHALSDAFTPGRLKSHLVILPDTEFTHFVRHSTEVAARIGLDYETKTVSGGALFYEEFLPAETLLYSLVLANDSRRKLAQRNGNAGDRRSGTMSASDVLNFVTSRLPERSILQIGGNETIGKGLCAVRFDVKKQSGVKESSK